jgi:type IV pilus assembly protein PilC
MMYPVVVLAMAGAIVGFILTKIVPKFIAIFREMGATLPGPTMILVHASDYLLEYWWQVPIVVFAIYHLLKFIYRFKTGAYVLDTIKLKIPVFGTLFQKSAVARFASTLGTLVTAGVPILQALDIVRDSSGNEVVARAMDEVYQSVKDGETIHEPLSKCSVFPPLVYHMVAVGEETGAIDQMLNKVAEAYEQEVEDMVDGLTSLLEPILIVGLGVLIGGVVVALYLPLFDLPNHIGN